MAKGQISKCNGKGEGTTVARVASRMARAASILQEASYGWRLFLLLLLLLQTEALLQHLQSVSHKRPPDALKSQHS